MADIYHLFFLELLDAITNKFGKYGITSWDEPGKDGLTIRVTPENAIHAYSISIYDRFMSIATIKITPDSVFVYSPCTDYNHDRTFRWESPGTSSESVADYVLWLVEGMGLDL